MLHRQLTAQGHTVIQASSGADALHHVRLYHGKLDLVLCDVVMPEMDGTELAAVLVREFPGLPIVLMSAQGGPPADYGGLFLPKPFTVEALVRAVLGFSAPARGQAREQ